MTTPDDDDFVSAKDLRKGGTSRGRAQGGGTVVDHPNKAVQAALEAFNREFAVVLSGDKGVILREGVDEEGRPEARFLDARSFTLWTQNRTLWLDEDSVPVSKLWLAWNKRRQFEGVVFAPDGCDDRYFNLWRGFAFTPDPHGDFSLFRDHVMDDVAQGRPEIYDWVMGWFAHLVQRPGERLGTSLALRGLQGSGKTLVGVIVGRLLEPHYVLVDDPRYITGNFNSHMLSALLLQADEGFWAGDKQAEGRLKGLVTSEYQFIEKKGIDPIRVRNLVRLMITSNSDWVVPAGYEERRFCVLDVAPDHAQDRAYFGALVRQMEAGGYAGLLHYLLTFDLDSVDLAAIPATEALYEQKISSLREEDAWWFQRLREGTVLPRHAEWEEVVPCGAVTACYMAHAERIGVRRKRDETQLGIALARRLVPIAALEGEPFRYRRMARVEEWDEEARQHYTSNKRVYAYRFPPLDVCRAHFAAMIGHPIDWGDDAAPEPDPPPETQEVAF